MSNGMLGMLKVAKMYKAMLVMLVQKVHGTLRRISAGSLEEVDDDASSSGSARDDAKCGQVRCAQECSHRQDK